MRLKHPHTTERRSHDASVRRAGVWGFRISEGRAQTTLTLHRTGRPAGWGSSEREGASTLKVGHPPHPPAATTVWPSLSHASLSLSAASRRPWM
jgi:hypothetical protein